MSSVDYRAPQTIAEAVGFLNANPSASVLAGGTDLLVQFRAGLKHPAAFLDVKRIPDLVGIRIDGSGLRLGAATDAAAIGESAELRRLWPGIAEAVALIGSAQIQGRGTVGGNFCNASPAADTPCAFIVNRAVSRQRTSSSPRDTRRSGPANCSSPCSCPDPPRTRPTRICG
jgi:aerobic carbon-monoxide dehydrogenase medium subunit